MNLSLFVVVYFLKAKQRVEDVLVCVIDQEI